MDGDGKSAAISRIAPFEVTNNLSKLMNRKIPLICIVALLASSIGIGLMVSRGVTQDAEKLSELEQRFSFVEIWDAKARSRKDFLNEIAACPAGICEQSLVQMGHLDGNKFPLPSGKLLLTTRDSPDFRDSPIYLKLKASTHEIDHDRWSSLDDPSLLSSESQLLPKFVKALTAGDKPEFDRIFKIVFDEFALYGIKLDQQKIRKAFEIYQQSTRVISKQEVLSALYFSDDETLIRSAGFIVGHYIVTPNDLVDILPLLLRKRVGVQATIEVFMKEFDGQIDWREQADFLPKLMNNPNPFQAVLVLKILDRTGFDRQMFDRCMSTQQRTFTEILQSECLSDERAFLLSFLNRYSTTPIECDRHEWLRRLETTTK
jgi:hypothetical protein